jgi:hypothetical protein
MLTYPRAACCAALTLAMAVMLSGCGGTPHPAARAAHGAADGAGRPLAKSTAAPEPPGLIILTVQLNPTDSIVFTGHPLSVTVLGGPPGGEWPLAQATVEFGDGSSQSVTSRCAGPGSSAMTASHAYQAAGRFVVRVTAARFCNPVNQPDLSSALGYPLVLPSAPAGSTAWPRCGQAQLRISAGLAFTGLGNRELLFTLRNVSSSDCQLYGYPGLRFAAPDGQLLPVTVGRGYLVPGVSPSLAALAPGGVASFDFSYAAGMRPASSCDWASEAEVFVPESLSYTMVSLASIGSGDDAAACGGGFQISPVIPGSTGIAHVS